MRINDLATQISATPELFARRAEEASQGMRQLAEGQPSNLMSASVSERMDQALSMANDRLQSTEASLDQVVAGRDVQQDTQSSLRDLSQVLERAQDRDLSAAEQSELQERFTRTLDELDGMQDRLQQVTARQDFPSLSSEQLGSGASESFPNIAALRGIDVTTADAGALSEAAAVATAASESVERAIGVSERRGAELEQQRDVFAGVVEALGGEPRSEGAPATSAAFETTEDPRLSAQAQAVQSFIQQLQGDSGSNPLMMPGSFLNFSA